jgi:hypothetical protein
LQFLAGWVIFAADPPAHAQVAEDLSMPQQESGPQPARPVTEQCSRGDDAITICGRRDRSSRYRLPLRDEHWTPGSGIESVDRERHRLAEGGEFGIGSCTNVGPGGYTGCFGRQVERARQRRAGH